MPPNRGSAWRSPEDRREELASGRSQLRPCRAHASPPVRRSSPGHSANASSCRPAGPAARLGWRQQLGPRGSRAGSTSGTGHWPGGQPGRPRGHLEGCPPRPAGTLCCCPTPHWPLRAFFRGCSQDSGPGVPSRGPHNVGEGTEPGGVGSGRLESDLDESFPFSGSVSLPTK